MLKKFYQFGKLKLWQKYCEFERRKHNLYYLFWETTLRCNLSCRHCGSSCDDSAINNDELATDEIKKTFSDIAEDFDSKKIMVAVTGGEPLLRQDVFEVMKHASELGFVWGMVTNGTLINSSNIRLMREAKMSTISVSLDGLKENHNWLRRDENAFDKTVNGIQKLVSSRYFDPVEVITCVHQKNFDEIEKIFSLIGELNVNAWRLFVIVPVGRAGGNDNLFLTDSQWRGLLDFVVEKRKKNKKIKIELCDEGFFGERYEGKIRDSLFYCWAGITVGSILYNGNIAACPILPREYVVQGNIRKDRFSKIWDTKFELFRNKDWRKIGICKDCSQWDFCEGNSLHLWNFDTKSLQRCNYNLINKGRG